MLVIFGGDGTPYIIGIHGGCLRTSGYAEAIPFKGRARRIRSWTISERDPVGITRYPDRLFHGNGTKRIKRYRRSSKATDLKFGGIEIAEQEND